MVKKVKGMSHTVDAADVSAGSIVFEFGDFMNNGNAVVQVLTTAGVVKAWDGAVVVAGGTVTVDNTGTTDWAATDVINVLAF